MSTERRLARYYFLSDAAQFLLWSPAVALAVVITVGFHVYDRPHVVDQRLEDAFNALAYLILASPAGTLIGWWLHWYTERIALTWKGGDLSSDGSGSRPRFPRRLGRYSIKRVHSHRESGVRLSRYRLIKPFRMATNSVFTATAIAAVLSAIVSFNSHSKAPAIPNPVGFVIGSVVMVAWVLGVLFWVHRRWVCVVSLVDGQCRLQVTTRSGPIFSRAFRGTIVAGRPEVRSSGAAVVVHAADRELYLLEFSPGPLGVWEAQQMSLVMARAMGLVDSRNRSRLERHPVPRVGQM